MAQAINPAVAAGAYGRGASLGGPQSAAGGDKKAVSFQDFLAEKTRDTIATLREGEAMVGQSVAGKKPPLPALVQAVTNADTALQTIVALRDRMISAYQDIMRMPL